MHDKQVYIIHGYGASPQHHWFPWLKEKLAQDGITAIIPALPDPEHPVKENWDACLKQTIGIPEKNTYFIAHSLGCIALLDYLQQLESPFKIGGLVLVSGFSSAVPGYSLINPFIAHALQPEKIIDITTQRVVIASQDDPIVPYELTCQLAQDLQARLLSVEHAGHFLGSDGFKRFPLLQNELSRIFSRQNAG